MINRGVAVLRSRLHGHGDHQDEAQETAQVAEERTHHVAALAMEMVYIIYMLYHVNVYIMYIIYNVIIYIYIWAIVKTLGSRKGHPQIWEGPIAYHTFVQ